jgi:hypothetical protein
MADTTLTGATTDVSVDTAAAKEAQRKKIIKWVIIVAAAIGVFFLVKKYVLKK